MDLIDAFPQTFQSGDWSPKFSAPYLQEAMT